MVVAGPGTGKTEVIAMRVANILRRTHMRPRNILCLTFSRSGATAMRKRLREILGADAYGVTVQTIHGFCNDIIGAYPQVFEEWDAREQISDVERYRELNTIIDQLLPNIALVSKKAPHSRTGDILSRMSQLKREGVTDAEELRKIADAYEERMAGKSREGTKAHEANLLMARKFRDFLEVFSRYQRMLLTTGRYDYDDMILHVIEALQREDWMLAGLQERYQYVLVDEFQDTNGAQYRFLDLLTTDPTGDEQPNFFVVGDDDQAIYRFQGANLANILSFRERFPDSPVIPLTVSYRCSQPILDSAGALIAQNTERLVGRIPGLEKRLTAVHGAEGDHPHLMLAASDASEPWLIADLLEDRLLQGIAPREIAVLVQTNRELPLLYEVFHARGIPVQLSGKFDLLTHPLVQQVLAILRAVRNPHDSGLLASALGCACFGCHPADLGRLFSLRREAGCTLHDLLLKLDCPLEPIAGAFADTPALLRTRDSILSLHGGLGSSTVVQTLERLLRECGLLAQYKQGAMDVLDFAAVQEFFDRLKRRAYEQPSFSFDVFLSDLEYYGNDDYSELRLGYDLPHLTEEGIQLMTAHKSKGLEFHTVILANFREGHWDRRKNPSSVSMPEDLLFGWEKDQKAFEQHQDERRVAFVAMTRAKRELIFTCAEELTSGDSMKAVSPSGFFAEAGNLPEVRSDVRDPGHMSTLLSVPERAFDKETKAFFMARLEQFSLSPTALNDFLRDPLLFVDRHLLQVPESKNPVLAYGNAIHHVLALWGISAREGTPITKSEALVAFVDHLQRKELLSKEEFVRFEHMGRAALGRYFDTALQPPYPLVRYVEQSISAHLGDIPIKGKIDRIDLHETHSSFATVFDYKTGRPKSPKEIQEYGYLRQLVFYALLIEQSDALPIDPKQFVLEFIGEEGEDPVRRSFAVSDQDKKELRGIIEQVWGKILSLDFTPIQR